MFARKIFIKAAHLALAALLVSVSAQSAPLKLQNVPLYLLSRADPNVMLNMSVETPMGGAAYADQAGSPTAACTARQNDVLGETSADDIGWCYFPATEYLGYFNAKLCYTYNASGYFEVASNAAADHSCTSQWSGNFLNWATMTAIDMFTWTMTGGNRVQDTTAITVIRRARKQDNNSWFPRKVLSSTINVAPSTVTPYSESKIFIHNTTWGFSLGKTFAAATGTPDIGSFEAKVRVCAKNASLLNGGLESNCVAYGTSPSIYHKPEGLIQGNATVKRFGVISYTFDGADTRDGGVLRSNMKYVGPLLADGTVNSKKEYGEDGILINNPDGAGDGLNSGVINYINKFSDPGYKTYDPIGELFYESVRYFKNLGPTPEYSSGITRSSADTKAGGFWFANTSADWEDPIQYRCQKNFAVAINDANPWLDKKLPGTHFTSSTISGAAGFDPFSLAASDYGQPSNADASIDVTALTNRVGELEGLNGTTWDNTGTWTSGSATGRTDAIGGGIGTWDNSCSTGKTMGKLGEVMGTCPAPQKQNSYYIAGLAYYANTTDLRTEPAFPNDRGIQNLNSFIIDTQEFNANPLDGPRNMLWLAGKYGGFVDANGDRIPQTAEWDADGNGMPDNYVLATQPKNLVDGLNSAFDFVNSQASSAASASVNAGSISSETRVYQAKFNSGEWSGQLLSLPVNTDGSLAPAEWDAEEEVPSHTLRQILTTNADTGVGAAFTWGSIGDTNQTLLDPGGDTLGSARLSYLRGDPAKEKQNGGPFRQRNKKLGDIVSSAPLFVGKPPFRYNSASYIEFRDLYAGRDKMVYAGANDGMLHAFDAESGAEKFAFVPGSVFKNLRLLTQPNYTHAFYVDGSPTMGDVFYDDEWHTVLVGGLNKGGQGIYALDITDPSQFSEGNAASIVKWEFTDKDDADLGYTYSRPAIVQVRNGAGTKWVAVFGNGYNNSEDDSASGGSASTTGHAALYFVDIEDGSLLRKIEINQGSTTTPNGLATPAPVDMDGDGVVDYVFAGDLRGNLWKFNLKNSDPDAWAIAFAGTPLFTARDGPTVFANRQPITSRPVVGRGPNGAGMVVLFGTGRFLESADRDVNTLKLQTFYGIFDPNTDNTSAGAVSSRNNLTRQTIDVEEVQTFGSESVPVRLTSENVVTNRGWYLDLVRVETAQPIMTHFKGEMQVSDSILRNGRIIFTTLIPNQDACGFGGTSWLMELDALSGARLNYTPFDLNGDGLFDANDYGTLGDDSKDATSGLQSEVGIMARPGILSGDGAEFKYTPGTSGNMQVIRENPGVGDTGRQSWRQMR
jgi:type IV pilus assembly protein PilY1